MDPVIGIDLGTTYSCLAAMVDGAAKVIPNLEGATTTPSMVCLTSSGETLVGNLALRQALTNPERTLYAIKRLIGQKFLSPRVQDARRRLPYALVEAANGDVQIEAGGRTITPQEVSAMVLGYLKKSAEAYFGQPVRDAVITVPAHFDDNQRQATRDAAVIAGLDVLRIINEPTAASLAYGLHRKRSGKVAVFDMGGGTFDITLLEISDGVFHVLATAGDSFLGGEDFDQRLVDWLLAEYRRETSGGPVARQVRPAADQGGGREGQARAVLHPRIRDQPAVHRLRAGRIAPPAQDHDPAPARGADQGPGREGLPADPEGDGGVRPAVRDRSKTSSWSADRPGCRSSGAGWRSSSAARPTIS